jgi:hypothetical protein
MGRNVLVIYDGIGSVDFYLFESVDGELYDRLTKVHGKYLGDYKNSEKTEQMLDDFYLFLTKKHKPLKINKPLIYRLDLVIVITGQLQ